VWLAGEHPGDIRSVESIVSSAIMLNNQTNNQIARAFTSTNSTSNEEVKRFENANAKHDKDPQRLQRHSGISAFRNFDLWAGRQ
jgi:hypothetical protein